MLHGAVVIGREHEADAGFGDALGDLLRFQVEIDAERLEHIGAARLAGNRTPAMLGDLRPGGG